MSAAMLKALARKKRQRAPQVAVDSDASEEEASDASSDASDASADGAGDPAAAAAAEDSDAFSAADDDSEAERGLDEYGRPRIAADAGGDSSDSEGASDGGDGSDDDDDDAAERDAVLAEMAYQQRLAADRDGGDDDDDGDSDSDASFHSVDEVTTKRGRVVYRVKLCPDVASFTTRALADEFMRGKQYRAALKRELRAVRAARRGLRENALDDAQLAKRDAKAAARRDKKRAAAKARKKDKLKHLSADQIAARQAKFQRKKARRADRKTAAAAA